MIIVDSNIIFSALLRENSYFLPVLLEDKNKFAAPYFLFLELFKHKEKILRYTKVREDKLLIILEELLSKIQFVPISLLSKISREKAYQLCKSIDENDSTFVALAIEYNAPLWTGDKKLTEGLRKQGFNNFYYPQF